MQEIIRSNDIYIKVNPSIKAKDEPIFTTISLTFNDVFNLMLKKISLKQKIPLELSSQQLTENGYTPEFEAELLAAAEESYAAIANGTAKLYKNTAEMFAEWDKEDAEDDD